jgi:N-acetylglucosaminyl-diphospho-decaprenol L-rhamnosyltransferase
MIGLETEDPKPPRLTVVVVNYNGGDYLQGCLHSLAEQTFRDFETILVDNASTDGSLDRLIGLPPECRIIRSDRNLGFAAANNLAAKQARGEWLVLLNPDAEALPDWLEELLRAAERRPDHRMLASLQLSMDAPDQLDGAGDCYLAYGFAWRGGHGHHVPQCLPAGICFAPCGAAAMYPRDVFLDAGGFDERYFCYHEDVDLGFRLRLMGESCQFVPTARIRHAGSAISGRRSEFSTFHGVRNGIWTYLKNMPAALLWFTLPVWTMGLIALLVRGCFRGTFGATWRGIGAGLAGYRYVLMERQALNKRRSVKVAEMASSLCWNPVSYLRRQVVLTSFEDD